jgi:hypothetical protein
MLTPIGDKTLEFIIKSLLLTDKTEQQYRIIEVLRRSTLLTCDQAEKIIDTLRIQEEFKMLRVIIFVELYEVIIDKENITKIKNKLNDEKELDYFNVNIEKSKQTATIYEEFKNFKTKDYDENPNIYIDKVAKIKSLTATPSGEGTSNPRKSLIPWDDFYALLNDASNDFKDSKKFCEKLKEKFRNYYISSNNVMDILTNRNKKPTLEFRRDVIEEVYPYLIDPQNVERLINNLVYTEMEYKLRESILSLPNLYFNIIGKEAERGACCGCSIF